LSFRDGPQGRTRNPYSAMLGLWNPGSPLRDAPE